MVKVGCIHHYVGNITDGWWCVHCQVKAQPQPERVVLGVIKVDEYGQLGRGDIDAALDDMVKDGAWRILAERVE